MKPLPFEEQLIKRFIEEACITSSSQTCYITVFNHSLKNWLNENKRSQITYSVITQILKGLGFAVGKGENTNQIISGLCLKTVVSKKENKPFEKPAKEKKPTDAQRIFGLKFIYTPKTKTNLLNQNKDSLTMDISYMLVSDCPECEKEEIALASIRKAREAHKKNNLTPINNL